MKKALLIIFILLSFIVEGQNNRMIYLQTKNIADLQPIEKVNNGHFIELKFKDERLSNFFKNKKIKEYPLCILNDLSF